MIERLKNWWHRQWAKITGINDPNYNPDEDCGCW